MISQQDNLSDNKNNIQILSNKPRGKMSIRASSLAEILRLEGSTSAEKVKEFVKGLEKDIPIQLNYKDTFHHNFTHILSQVCPIIYGFCLFFLADRIFMFYTNGGMNHQIALNILGIIGASFILLLLLILNK